MTQAEIDAAVMKRRIEALVSAAKLNAKATGHDDLDRARRDLICAFFLVALERSPTPDTTLETILVDAKIALAWFYATAEKQ